jgi:3,2-trans-enoyl-CoA isomerase
MFVYVAATARKFSKLRSRKEAMEWLAANRQADLEQFVGFVGLPAVQEGLGLYLKSLKKKQ